MIRHSFSERLFATAGAVMAVKWRPRLVGVGTQNIVGPLLSRSVIAGSGLNGVIKAFH